jgi:hypothetical protein
MKLNTTNREHVKIKDEQVQDTFTYRMLPVSLNCSFLFLHLPLRYSLTFIYHGGVVSSKEGCDEDITFLVFAQDFYFEMCIVSFFLALLFSSFHCRKLELISLDYLKG